MATSYVGIELLDQGVKEKDAVIVAKQFFRETKTGKESLHESPLTQICDKLPVV